MKLAIVINEFLSAPTAHMLYISRLACAAAQTSPQDEVHLIFPASPANKTSTPATKTTSSPAYPKNVFLHPLVCLRKQKHRNGLTLNFIFYHASLHCLKNIAPDIVFSASFPKLWKFLLAHRKALGQTRFAYEVHDFPSLNPGFKKTDLRRELKNLQKTDLIITKTQALSALLKKQSLSSQVMLTGHPPGLPL